MKSITYIGMDVHTTNYTLCCYSVEDDRFFAEIEVKPDYQEVLKYINRVKSQRGKEAEILCGSQREGTSLDQSKPERGQQPALGV